MNWELFYLSGGFILGVIASAVHSAPRIKDLKREIEFWRNQSKQYEERDRIVSQEIARLKGTTERTLT
jgi:hypothetical protein